MSGCQFLSSSHLQVLLLQLYFLQWKCHPPPTQQVLLSFTISCNSLHALRLLYISSPLTLCMPSTYYTSYLLQLFACPPLNIHLISCNSSHVLYLLYITSPSTLCIVTLRLSPATLRMSSSYTPLFLQLFACPLVIICLSPATLNVLRLLYMFLGLS